MSEKEQKAKELFKSGYNCAQAVIGVFAEESGLDFETAMKTALPFGGGMGRMREVCGAVSGMLMAAGLKFSDEKAANKAEVYKITQELAGKFKEQNGSIICRELLEGIENSNTPTPSKRDEAYYKKRPCVELVGDCVLILEEYLKTKELAKKEN